MLAIAFVQILAGASLVSILGGFVLSHVLPHTGRNPARVLLRSPAGERTIGAWVTGTLVVTFWSIGVLVVPAYWYDWPALPDFPDSAIVQIAGFVVTFVGGSLFFLASRALGREMTPVIQIREGHELVTSGPYRYIRHPVYTAILIGAVGFTALYLSLPLGLLTVLLVGLASYRSRLEEGLLASPQGFGDTYTSYIARTGRFLPRIFRRT